MITNVRGCSPRRRVTGPNTVVDAIAAGKRSAMMIARIF